MRIVSIGCPVPSPNVDNHSIANAPSIFDYDACIIDPQSVSEQIEGIAATTLDVKAHDGRAISLGESGAFHFGLAELLQAAADGVSPAAGTRRRTGRVRLSECPAPWSRSVSGS